MSPVSTDNWQLYLGILDSFKIALSIFVTLDVVLVQTSKLYAQKARLNFVKTAISTKILMMILLGAAVIAKAPDLIGNFFIIGDDSSTRQRVHEKELCRPIAFFTSTLLSMSGRSNEK